MSEPKFESAVRGVAPLPAPQGGTQPGLTEAVSFSAAAQSAVGVASQSGLGVAGQSASGAPSQPVSSRVIKAETRAVAPEEVLVPVADIPEAPGWALVLVAIALAAWFLRRHG
jgi:hypothetical protein